MKLDEIVKAGHKEQKLWYSLVSKPHNMQIEFVQGCNRRCDFCGIHSLPKGEFKFMDLMLAEKISWNVGKWLNGKRIEFAMHGEPLLHPEVLDIIRFFRVNSPNSQLQLTTNGDMLMNGKVDINDLFEMGLNILIVDTYGERKDEDIAKLVHLTGVEILNYYKDDFNPYHYHSNKIKVLLIMSDIGKLNNKRKARKILNHAGNVNFDLVKKYGVYPVKSPLKKKCSRVYREMTVHWDGSVSICCIDWKHEFIVGNVTESSLEDIWCSKVWDAVRQRLYEKDRTFAPCNKCDYDGGFRLGFLKPVG